MVQVDRRCANHYLFQENSQNNLDNLSKNEFVEVWKIIAGEAPAIMLDSHTEMLRMLFEGIISESLLNQVALAFSKSLTGPHEVVQEQS